MNLFQTMHYVRLKICTYVHVLYYGAAIVQVKVGRITTAIDAGHWVQLAIIAESQASTQVLIFEWIAPTFV